MANNKCDALVRRDNGSAYYCGDEAHWLAATFGQSYELCRNHQYRARLYGAHTLRRLDNTRAAK